MQTLAGVCSVTLLHSVQLCTQAVRCYLKLIHCNCQSPVPVSKSNAWGLWLLGGLAGWITPTTGCSHQLLAGHGFYAWVDELAAAAAASCTHQAVSDGL